MNRQDTIAIMAAIMMGPVGGYPRDGIVDELEMCARRAAKLYEIVRDAELKRIDAAHGDLP